MYTVKVFYSNHDLPVTQIVRLNCNVVAETPEQAIQKVRNMCRLDKFDTWVFSFESLTWSPYDAQLDSLTYIYY